MPRRSGFRLSGFALAFLFLVGPALARDVPASCNLGGLGSLVPFSARELRLDAPPATDEAVAVEFRRGTYVADAVVLDAAGRVLAIEIPPLPDGPEPASARVALLNSSGGVELLCDWHEVSLAPARVEDGALLKLAQGGSGALRALEELGTALDTRIPTSTIDLLRVNLFRLTSFYAVMDAHDRFRLDAFATALMRRGFAMERLAADTRALAAMVAPDPGRRGDLGREGPFPHLPVIRASASRALGLSTPAWSAFRKTQAPSTQAPSTPAPSTPVPNEPVCPSDPAQLVAMIERAFSGKMHSLAEINQVYTYAQLSAVSSAALFGALGGPGTSAEATSFVGSLFAIHSIRQDFVAGMFPAVFVELKSSLDNYPVYEDSPSRILRVDGIRLVTRSRGWDIKKAALDVGLARFAAKGGETPLQAGGNRFLDARLALKGGPTASQAAGKELISATLNALDGQIINSTYGEVDALGDKAGRYPPVECETDVSDPAYSRVELHDPGAFEKVSHLEIRAREPGRARYSVQTQPIDAFLLLEGFPGRFPEKTLELGQLGIELTGFRRRLVGGTGSRMVARVVNSASPDQEIEWKSDTPSMLWVDARPDGHNVQVFTGRRPEDDVALLSARPVQSRIWGKPVGFFMPVSVITDRRKDPVRDKPEIVRCDMETVVSGLDTRRGPAPWPDTDPHDYILEHGAPPPGGDVFMVVAGSGKGLWFHSDSGTVKSKEDTGVSAADPLFARCNTWYLRNLDEEIRVFGLWDYELERRDGAGFIRERVTGFPQFDSADILRQFPCFGSLADTIDQLSPSVFDAVEDGQKLFGNHALRLGDDDVLLFDHHPPNESGRFQSVGFTWLKRLSAVRDGAPCVLDTRTDDEEGEPARSSEPVTVMMRRLD